MLAVFLVRPKHDAKKDHIAVILRGCLGVCVLAVWVSAELVWMEMLE